MTESQSIYQFDYQIEDEDYYDFNKYHFMHSKSSRKMLIVIKCFLVILYFLPVVLRREWNLFIGHIISAIIIIPILYFFVRYATYFFIKLSIRFMKKDGKLYEKNIKIRFDEDYFYEKTESNDSKITYTSIEKIAEGKTAVYIYVGAMKAFVIPYTLFETDEEIIRFIRFLNEKVLDLKSEKR